MKKGDRVKLKADSRYSPTKNNPKVGSKYECDGIITSINLNLSVITVDWNNGQYNTYKKEDLEVSECGCCVSLW